jgi:hypothetical protein
MNKLTLPPPEKIYLYHLIQTEGDRGCVGKYTETFLVNFLRNPGIDSKPGGPVRQPYFITDCQAK